VCLAGEGTGATVAAAVALLSDRMSVNAVALAPRRYAKIKDFPLPLPELAGAALAGAAHEARKSLRIAVADADREWWSSEAREYDAIGFPTQLSTVTDDAWRADLERENAVRAALGLASRTPTPGAAKRYIVADGPRARAWARRLALQRRDREGELVAVLSAAPKDDAARELSTEIHAADFRSDRALPRCPGSFGGTTVVVLPADMPLEEVGAWLALENDDPLAKSSRFHRLKVATTSGEHALSNVLAECLEKNRKNVLLVPAVFCAGADEMRALKESVREFEDKMTLNWRPGLGAVSGDPH
jgi:hypothetical protein